VASARRSRQGGSVRPVVVLFVALIVVAVIALRLRPQPAAGPSRDQANRTGCSQVGPAFQRHQNGVWLSLSARVSRLLPDTDGGREHQRFVVTCSSGQTVLVVNDVSIGQRVPVQVGDEVAARGQYIWTAQGGLVHFTHHALSGNESGWILLDRRVYSLAFVRLA
jgi:hypothetical protein